MNGALTKPADIESRTLRLTKSTVFLTEYMEESVYNKEFLSRVITSVSNIGINYLHACETTCEGEFLLKINVCKRDISETMYWLRLIRNTNSLWSSGHINCLISECLELDKIFKSIQYGKVG